MSRSWVFEKAEILCYRIFDVADEIDLEQARQLLALESQRLKLSREGSEYLLLPNPPLTAQLAPGQLTLRDGREIAVSVRARLFDYGAVSIIVAVPIERGTTLEQLIPFADELFDSHSLEEMALSRVRQMRETLAPALEAPHLWGQNESYTVVIAEKIQGDPTAHELLEADGLSRLLIGEVGPTPLSDYERNDVVSQHFSYTERDLVVVDWNSAFVYEPSGSRDIPDILEICNAQLLELRYYDDVLDGELRGINHRISKQRRRWYSIIRSPYRSLTRKMLVTLFELSEFVERVENSLKIIGDVYLAKVYEASLRQLRISPWQASVTRKQQLLAQSYQLLKGEVETDRSLLLEITITALIVIELIVAVGSLVR